MFAFGGTAGRGLLYRTQLRAGLNRRREALRGFRNHNQLFRPRLLPYIFLTRFKKARCCVAYNSPSGGRVESAGVLSRVRVVRLASSHFGSIHFGSSHFGAQASEPGSTGNASTHMRRARRAARQRPQKPVTGRRTWRESRCDQANHGMQEGEPLVAGPDAIPSVQGMDEARLDPL